MAAVGKQDAIVAVLRRDARVLVIRRGASVIFPGYWTPLSGRVELGETQEEALVREVREEVGVSSLPVAKVWECETEDGAFLLHWWIADADSGSGELVLEADEVSDARWIRPEEFVDLHPTFAADREFFARVLPGLPTIGQL